MQSQEEMRCSLENIMGAGVAWFLGALRLVETYVFFPYLAIPIALLPGMVRIVAEYQR